MKEDKIDIKLILFKALKYWYIFAIAMLLIAGGTYYHLKTTVPHFKASAMLLIKNQEGSHQLDEEALFAELGLSKGNTNLENEKLYLRSTPLMEQVVHNLELQYRYYLEGPFRRHALYHSLPVKIVSWEPAENVERLDFSLLLDGKGGYQLTTIREEEEKTYKGEFGKSLRLPVGKLTLSRQREIPVDSPLSVDIRSVKSAASMFAENLSIEVIGEESSTFYLSIEDESPDRAQDILDELMDTYNQESILEKNQVYQNSIDLINERIFLINQELSSAEKNVEAYKQSFNMMELSAEGTMLRQKMSEYDQLIFEVETELEILNSIEDFLGQNRNTFEFVPTNLQLTNMTLAGQLENFNVLLKERARLRSELGPSHPELLLTERQIQNLRKTIVENIASIRKDLEITRDANLKRKASLDSQMQSLPQRERQLFEMERQKGVKENLYLYLLQKREESAISQSVTVAKGKMIEPSSTSYTPVSPNKKVILLSAFFLALALPTGLILLIETLNDKLQPEDEIDKLVSVPMGGIISWNKKKETVVVDKGVFSAQAELFRLLRANLSYIGTGQPLRKLLVTSCISGEGKSFISINLAMSIALSGKKVILLELDLRKPKQEDYIHIERDLKKGLVNYLVDPALEVQKVIRNTNLHPNFDIITSGPKPPNPSELLLSERLREMIDQLQNEYDMIIIDAPPVGLVADALQMKDIADATLFVVRVNYTRKGHLKIINDIAEKDKLPRPFAVINAVNLSSNYSGAYGYGYGYGYGSGPNGYYEDENKNKKDGILARLSSGIFSNLLS